MRKYTKKEKEKILLNIKKYAIWILSMSWWLDKNITQVNAIGKVDNLDNLGIILGYLDLPQQLLLEMNLDVLSSKYIKEFKKLWNQLNKKELSLVQLWMPTAKLLD